MNLSCIGSIRTNYSILSDTEKRIADYILKNPEQIIHRSINQLADELNVADSTVFRFCKRIGFKGYQALKISLASEVMGALKDIHEEIRQGDNVLTVSEKVFQSNIKTIEDTMHLLDQMTMDNAVEVLCQAKKIFFFGNGGSGIIAMDAYHKFIRTGLPVYASTDSHIQLMTASQMTPDDCAVFISHSGSTKDILLVLDIVKDTGASSIGITNFSKSPLSKKVDISLFTLSDETDYRSEALSSRIAQLTLIDALYVNIMMKQADKGQAALQKMRQAISLKRI
ncbi:MurR/RpiR family transcriptional regulator [Falsibacillus pallidus]|uniref:RpiR family transcriptional regulator n=1 Tax=Falsibacillus pallidus TaxID=493781 RepID=A0A370GHB0_9BACI|nr:MurR/RpiR family transcriptional regulator [Falsibacillus pallidus]RDI43162.1 RpiR family transcriptional regulator [Falsibacillus pallidus]